MRIDIISVVPDLLKSPFDASILKRAIEAKLVEVHITILEITQQTITNPSMTINLVEVPVWL
jgi:tRNA G37 N-methylase TrmD